MVNALLVTNNFDFAKKLLDEFRNYNLDIRIGGIKSTTAEALLVLEKSSIDLIFFDKSITKDFDKAFLKKYKDIIVTISNKDNSPLISPRSLKSLNAILENYDIEIRRQKVIKELQYIGYKFKYKGTQYLLDTILIMYLNQDSMTDNLQSNIYPIIAEKYHKTIMNVKSSINKATESMYCECDPQVLLKYFQFTADYKPTVKQVIYAIVNKL